MPADSAKAQRFFGLCAHSDHPPERCPSRKVSREMAHKPKGGYRKGGKKSRR